MSLYSYQLAVERVLGKTAKILIDIMIALTQYFITLTHIVFLVMSCKSTIDALFNVDSSLVIYCVIVVTLFTLMSWVRNLAHFSFTFMLGNLMVVITMIFVTI